jgi:hypothetical protein
MYRSDPKKALRSVRLYPRLATNNSAGQALRRRKRISNLDEAASDADPAGAARAEVQARLLQMILDNEMVRRNEQRPNQT